MNTRCRGKKSTTALDTAMQQHPVQSFYNIASKSARDGFHGSGVPRIQRPADYKTGLQRITPRRSNRRLESQTLLTPIHYFREDLRAATCLSGKRRKPRQARAVTACCGSRGGLTGGLAGLSARMGVAVDLPWGRLGRQDGELHELAAVRGHSAERISRRGRKLVEAAFVAGDLGIGYTIFNHSPDQVPLSGPPSLYKQWSL